jgi:hypothetical protein
MFRVVTVRRALSVILAAVMGLSLSTAPSAYAATAQSDPATVGMASVSGDTAVAATQSGTEVAAQSPTGDAGTNSACQTRGWPYYYQVRCVAWFASMYFAWIYCTSLSSSWPSYKTLSGPRSTAGGSWGAWTERLECWPSTEYYISNAGWSWT